MPCFRGFSVFNFTLADNSENLTINKSRPKNVNHNLKQSFRRIFSRINSLVNVAILENVAQSVKLAKLIPLMKAVLTFNLKHIFKLRKNFSLNAKMLKIKIQKSLTTRKSTENIFWLKVIS